MQAFGGFYDETYREVYLPQLRPATQQRCEALMRQGLLAFWGKYPLDQIDFPLVRRYEANVAEPRRENPRAHQLGPQRAARGGRYACAGEVYRGAFR